MREAVRAIVIRPDDQGDGEAVLLARSHDRLDETRTWWELPGGGIEAGESHDEALRREIREETGYLDVSIDQRVCDWTTTWVFTDREVTQHDVVYSVELLTTDQVEPTPLESEGLAEVVWVPLALLDDLKAPMVPSTLSELIAGLRGGGEAHTIEMPPRMLWPAQ